MRAIPVVKGSWRLTFGAAGTPDPHANPSNIHKMAKEGKRPAAAAPHDEGPVTRRGGRMPKAFAQGIEHNCQTSLPGEAHMGAKQLFNSPVWGDRHRSFGRIMGVSNGTKVSWVRPLCAM